MTEFTVDIEQSEDGEFRVRFGDPDREPISGPRATELLAAAIGQCLSASLLFCARKSRVAIGPLRAHVTTRLVSAGHGKQRIAGVDVEIDPAIPETDAQRAQRCLGLFEDYCTVTQSIREGFPVNITVKK